MNPRLLLHLEGAAALAMSLYAYRSNNGSWLLFVALFLLPDVSMLGYFVNARVGAVTYNTIHTYIGALLLAGYSIGARSQLLLLLSLIWCAHIGFDRMVDFGLKYSTRFKDTQLNPERHASRIA